MAEIKVGLSARTQSYWDPDSNLYLTPANSVKTVVFDPAIEADAAAKNRKLDRIAHALFCQYPALVLYEGELPAETVERWKARYNAWGAPQAKKRADQVAGGTIPVNAKAVGAPEELTLFSAAEADAEAAKQTEAEEAAAKQAADAEKPAADAEAGKPAGRGARNNK